MSGDTLKIPSRMIADIDAVASASRRVIVVDPRTEPTHGSNASERDGPQIVTFNGNQHLVYWNRNDNFVIVKRALPDGELSYHVLTDVSLSVKDAHWAPAISVDENGRLLICYNTRASSIKWRYSTNPEDITSWSAEQVGMTGANENTVSNPMFVNGGDTGKPLLFFFRSQDATPATAMVNVWDPDELEWSALHHPLITGAGDPNAGTYVWTPADDEDGVIHLFWNWIIHDQEDSGIGQHSDLMYAKSTDGGTSWTEADGTPYSLPITRSTAELVADVPVNSGMDNHGYGARDPQGRGHAAYKRFDANGIYQIFHAFWDGSEWQNEQVSHRVQEGALTGPSGSIGVHRRPVSRPGIEVYGDGTALIITRDYEYGNGLVFYEKEPGGAWRPWLAGGDNLVGWGPKWDRSHFRRTNELHLLISPLSDTGAEPQLAHHEAPFSIWEFRSRAEMRRRYPPRIAVVATASRSELEDSFDTESTSYGVFGPRINTGFASHDPMPTHARFLVEVQDEGDVRMRVGRFGVTDGTGLTQVFFGERTWDDEGGGWLDSGWVSIPVITTAHGDNLPDYAFVSLQARSADGQLFRVRHWTLMLGAKVEIPDMVGSPP